MNDHYYTANPSAASNPYSFHYKTPSGSLMLTSDSGVFSKDGVDVGSDLLIRTLPAWQGALLDLGCGYGPIGLSMAQMQPASPVIMVDVNLRAVELARQNALNNHIDNATVLQSDGFENVTGNFGLIVTNPPIRAGKAVFFPWCLTAFERLETGGAFYTVIRKRQGADSLARHIRSIFGNCETVTRDTGFHVLIAKK